MDYCEHYDYLLLAVLSISLFYRFRRQDSYGCDIGNSLFPSFKELGLIESLRVLMKDILQASSAKH